MADAWAVFLDQLATAHGAGLPPGQAVVLSAHAAGGALSTKAADWEQRINAGESIAQAVNPPDPLVKAVLLAGERSGRLAELCRLLAKERHFMASINMTVLGKCLYPVILAHVATFLPALVAWIAGASALWMLAGPTLIWGVILSGLLWWQRDRGQSSWWLVGPLGSLAWPLITSRACTALAAGGGAGMLADESVELAGSACGQRVVEQRLRQQAVRMRGGHHSVTQAMRESGFPEWATSRLQSGELSGSLVPTAEAVAVEAGQRFRLRAEWAARIVSGTIYGLAVVIAVAAIIYMFKRFYVDTIMELGRSI